MLLYASPLTSRGPYRVVLITSRQKKCSFSNCFVGAKNLYGPLSLCSESIARVGKKQKPVFPGLKPGFGSKTRWFWPMNTSYTHCDEKQTFLVQNLMLNSFLGTKISENTQKTRFHNKTPLSLTSDKIEHAINLLKPHSMLALDSNIFFHEC